jgi:hypothetical protein
MLTKDVPLSAIRVSGLAAGQAAESELVIATPRGRIVRPRFGRCLLGTRHSEEKFTSRALSAMAERAASASRVFAAPRPLPKQRHVARRRE